MAKEIETKICTCCDSQYKLVYELSQTSGFAKFCPFCQSDIEDEPKIDTDEDMDD